MAYSLYPGDHPKLADNISASLSTCFVSSALFTPDLRGRIRGSLDKTYLDLANTQPRCVSAITVEF